MRLNCHKNGPRIVIGGDYNTLFNNREPVIKYLADLGYEDTSGGEHVRTERALPLFFSHLDRIFYRNLRKMKSGVVDIGVSDHLPVYAEFEL